MQISIRKKPQFLLCRRALISLQFIDSMKLSQIIGGDNKMKFLIAFIISFFALTKAGFSQYQKEQGYIAVEGQQYLNLESQIELLNETAIEDQWRVYLSL